MMEERRESKVVSRSDDQVEYSDDATDWMEREGGRPLCMVSVRAIRTGEVDACWAVTVVAVACAEGFPVVWLPGGAGKQSTGNSGHFSLLGFADASRCPTLLSIPTADMLDLAPSIGAIDW